ncbi:MAG: 5-aminolevulinate synthase [Steroidobacteraceae bacterium]
MFDYEGFFADSLELLRSERRYRVFRELERMPGRAPWARTRIDGRPREVVVWCSNDYLGMSQHPVVLEASREALARCGAGAGGTRNISGTLDLAVELEAELAGLHGQQAALLFSSGYVANDTTLATLAGALPGCVIVSDTDNHASMIEGMRRSRAERRVFAHSDPQALDAVLRGIDPERPRIVAFESLYSMGGDVAPLRELLAVVRRHGALSYVDETHAVGVHGPRGGGLLEAEGLCGEVDVIQGGLGKGYGVVGGFITGSRALVDFVRSHAPGFIFTTALPPAVLAGALASVRHLARSGSERAALQRRVAGIRRRLLAAGLPVLPTRAQILPLAIGDSGRCQAASDRLLRDFGVYLQPINYPTVPRGAERLRLTPSPLHDDAMEDRLLDALAQVLVPQVPAVPVATSAAVA